MDFNLCEDDLMIQDTARRFAEGFLSKYAEKMDRESKFDLACFKASADQGFTSVTIPEEYDGLGLGNMQLSIVLEEISKVCASTGVTLSVHNSLANGVIIKYGSKEQKENFLPKLGSGEWLGAYSLTEPNSGSDASALICKGVKQGDYYVLNGVKSFVSSAEYSDVIVVFVRTGENRTKGITAFLVETTVDCFSVSKSEKKMGLRGSKTNEITFTDCKIPVANVLGAEGDGFKIAMEALDGGRIGIASQALGIGQAAFESAVRYANERDAFGKKLKDMQAIQLKISDMAVKIEAARLLVQRAAWRRDNGMVCTKEAAMAKLFASEAAGFITDEAMQILGGVGYTEDFPVERYYRDARVTRIYEGTSEIQRLVISRSFLRD